MKKIILASGSPRRAELLNLLGIEYRVADRYGIDELYPHTMPSIEVPAYLSKLKSEAYPEQLAADELLITADTVVICDEQILGKPVDRADAAQMLTTLSGNTHTVATGVTLRTAGSQTTFTDIAKVTFCLLTPSQIEYYLDTFKPYDKAGAYGIQEWIGAVAIERIEGSFYTVMGLPTSKLFALLNKM